MHAQDGHTALLKAALNGHLKVVQALVEGGANVNLADKVCACITCMVCSLL